MPRMLLEENLQLRLGQGTVLQRLREPVSGQLLRSSDCELCVPEEEEEDGIVVSIEEVFD